MMARNRFFAFLTASVLLAACSRATTAEVMYDSIGEGSTGEGAFFAGHLLFASLVQLDGTARRVASLELNLHAIDAPLTNVISVAIHLNDSDGLVPGSLLWESAPREFLLTTNSRQRVAIDVPFVSVPDQFWVIASIPHDLHSGLPLRFRAIEQEAFVGQNHRNLIGHNNADDFRSNDAAWAMAITAVPEPSTWGLLLTGLAAAGVLRGRKRKTDREI